MCAASNSDAINAINALIHSYVESIDTGHFERVGELFAFGFFQHGDQEPLTGAAVGEFFRNLVKVYEDGTPRTHHVITNSTVTIEGNDIGRASSYYLVLQQAEPGTTLQVVAAGAYRDVFTCYEGTWRFQNRKIERHFTGDMSKHVHIDPHRT